MATRIEMNIGDNTPNAPYPHVIIEDRSDAQTLCDILQRNGVAVNLREVENPYTQRSLRFLTVGSKTEHSITATDGTGSVAPEELTSIIEVGDSYILEIYKFNHIGGFVYKGNWYGRKTDKEIIDYDRKLIEESIQNQRQFVEDNREAFARREEALPDWAKEILDVNRQHAVDDGENFETKPMGWAYTLVALELAVLYTNLGDDVKNLTTSMKYADTPDHIREFEEKNGLSGNQVSWAQMIARGYLNSKDTE